MTCPHCAAGHPLSLGHHFQFANRTWFPLGACTRGPDETPEARADLAAAKLHEMATRKSAVSVLASLPMPKEPKDVPLPHNEVAEREPGEDG